MSFFLRSLKVNSHFNLPSSAISLECTFVILIKNKHQFRFLFWHQKVKRDSFILTRWIHFIFVCVMWAALPFVWHVLTHSKNHICVRHDVKMMFIFHPESITFQVNVYKIIDLDNKVSSIHAIDCHTTDHSDNQPQTCKFLSKILDVSSKYDDVVTGSKEKRYRYFLSLHFFPFQNEPFYMSIYTPPLTPIFDMPSPHQSHSCSHWWSFSLSTESSSCQFIASGTKMIQLMGMKVLEWFLSWTFDSPQ